MCDSNVTGDSSDPRPERALTQTVVVGTHGQWNGRTALGHSDLWPLKTLSHDWLKSTHPCTHTHTHTPTDGGLLTAQANGQVVSLS